MAVSDDQPDKEQSEADMPGGKRRKKAWTGSVGPKKRNGRKGVGTQGRRYAREMMRQRVRERKRFTLIA